MRSKSLERYTPHARHGASGFSLIEMVSVLAISIVISVISVMSLIPMLKQQRVNNAYNITLSALRQARDNAVSQRTSYSVTFSSTGTPNTIVVAPVLPTGGVTFTGDQTSVTYKLPTDVTFLQQSGYPNPGPDGFGTGINPIDFGYTANGAGTQGGGTTIYFCPDGSAQDSEGGAGNCLGSWDSGVVYIGRAGEITSARAISLWGGTGRLRGWRLYSAGSGVYQWVRQ